MIEKDTKKRSFMKMISWRVIGSLDTLLISWVITGQIVVAASIMSIEVVSKMVLYYFHERIWNNISFGKKKK